MGQLGSSMEVCLDDTMCYCAVLPACQFASPGLALHRALRCVVALV